MSDIEDISELPELADASDASVPAKAGTLSIFKKQNAEIDSILKRLKNQIKRKQAAFDILNTQNANLQFEFEREKARKMGIFWLAIVILSYCLMLYSYARGSKGFTALNTYGFISNFRGIYVRRTPYAFAVALAICLATLYVA